MAEAKILVFILTFMSLIAIAGFFGQDLATGEDLEALPVLDDDVGLFGTIGYGFEFVGYILLLQGFTVLGLPASIGFYIGLVLNGALLYVLIRLVRGGG